MRILLTGGGGFLGARLARELLKAGQIDGRPITELAIADLAPPPADLLADPRVKAHTGPMLSQTALFASGFDGVFHLASAVSGECELDFELGLRSNLDSTLPSPQTSYGTHKLMCEYLVADYTRKGYIDGRSARLMTVTVRPGKPNGAASSFFSGIIREPLAGVEATCPVDPGVTHPVSSPAHTVKGLITVYQATREAMGGRLALNLPGLNVRVGDMLDALEAVAGKKVRARVRFERDERIAGIVANWSRGSTADRAKALGLLPETSFRSIIEQYIADCRERPGYPADALRGLD